MIKENKKTPEIRFPGFTEDWEQRKVGDISTITAGGTPSTKEISYWEPKEIPWLASGEVHKKYVHDTEEKISEEGLKNSSAKWVKEGSVLIALAGQGKTRGTAAITRVPITTNQSIAAIKFDDILDADYAFHNLDSRYEELRGISSGDGTRGGLNKQLLSDLAIMFPQIDEQVKIGQYFTNLDNLITLHQRKCDALQTLKKSMLQKMFPKKGSSVPEIRFPSFTEDWEQRKLGEFANIVTGKLDANAMKEDGEYDFYTSGIQKYKIDVPAFEGPAITIAGNGATVGYMHLADGKFNAYQRTYVLSEFQANREFLFYEIGNKLPKKIAQEARTGNIPYIVMDMLTDLKISIPSEQEQKIVGEYLINLDHLITLHQRKCDTLKELKKGMLQKMFV